MKAPIHSNKHYVQKSLVTVTAGTLELTTIVSSVKVVDKNTVLEVEEGALVKAVYVEMWARGATTSGGSFVFIIVKLPSGVNDPSTTEMAALGDWDNKKNVFYTTQALANSSAADAIPLFKGWIKIPKGKQRMGLGDKIKLVYFAQALDTNICGFATYKEYL